MTTYLTIDSSGAHGNNGYKTAKEDFPWNRSGYKKPFAAERTLNPLFGCVVLAVQLHCNAYCLLKKVISKFCPLGNFGCAFAEAVDNILYSHKNLHSAAKASAQIGMKETESGGFILL